MLTKVLTEEEALALILESAQEEGQDMRAFQNIIYAVLKRIYNSKGAQMQAYQGSQAFARFTGKGQHSLYQVNQPTPAATPGAAPALASQPGAQPIAQPAMPAPAPVAPVPGLPHTLPPRAVPPTAPMMVPPAPAPVAPAPLVPAPPVAPQVGPAPVPPPEIAPVQDMPGRG